MYGVVAISICACTQNEYTEIKEKSVESELSHLVTIDEAVKNAEDYLNTLPVETRNGTGIPEVKDVITYSLRDKGYVNTRSETDYPVDAPVFYAINYKDNKGFVLASTDDRYIPVYAYVPEGNFDKNYIPESGFKLVVENLIHKVTDPEDTTLLQENNASIQTRTYPSAIGHKLTTQWGRGYPYNCHSFYSNVVSTAVALTQVCAYFRHPSHIDYADYGDSVHVNIDWDAIRSVSYANNRHLVSLDTCAHQVGHMMHFFEYHYNDVTLSNVNRCLNWMRGLGFSIPQAMVNVDNDSFDNYARAAMYDVDGVVFVEGYAQLNWDTAAVSDGWSWIIDGFAYEFYHCNWGLNGNYDGLFQKSLFKPYEGKHYKYKLYSVRITND